MATPGLTAVDDAAEARRVLLDEALAAAELLEEGPVVDVGSGGGSPGIPLAFARPDLSFVLLESQRRRCAFLEEWSAELPNVRVLCARAEEHARAQGRDAYGTAVARAVAPPPVALEWLLPLVRPGGVALLFVGPSAEREAAARAAGLVAGKLEPAPPGFIRARKVGATPARFPRRPGIARKRPLA